MFDLSEFEEVSVKKVTDLEAGKVYEISYERKTETGTTRVSRIYYVASIDEKGYRVISENKFSDWSDFDGILTKTSSRKFQPEYDMFSLEGKNIEELGKRDSKNFIKNCIKSFSIRKQFDLPAARRRSRMGKMMDITSN